MKKYEVKGSKLYTGTAREILSLYKNYRKRELADADFVFASYPEMDMSRNYGLLITNFDEIEERIVEPYMTVLNESTVLELL